ncbi:MAG: formylglycine-generating enzyme family protein [Anaerolineae bacterium]|nr:formylglycine-generating enzyme family protein [Anaerolineae bacterium]
MSAKELNLEFVLIPAGEFIIGSNPSADRLAQTDEEPQHRLHISNFYIMRYPVANKQYALFVQATGHRPPRFWPDGRFPAAQADHPVVGVSFHDAAAFCQWAAAVTDRPIRLPTEPEWEKAARGPDGRLYPWGNQWHGKLCNHGEGKPAPTTPVNQFSPQGDSPYGVADVAGNAQEWCSSLFGPYPYDPNDGREVLVYNLAGQGLMPRWHETGCVANPQQIEAALDKQTIRGGSRRQGRQNSRCAYRSWAAPLHRSDDTGFRCCYEPQE